MHGNIDNEGRLKAKINIGNNDILKAKIGITKQIKDAAITMPSLIPEEVYKGETVITPSSYFDQELKTKGKLVKSDITVKQTPYYETANSTGKTIYIGNEDLVVFGGGN